MKREPFPGTILIVEDDFVLRAALAELLEDQGYAVECAANGVEALHLLNSGIAKPSLIVLDLTMPYMDGIEFRAIQRSLPALADIPVVVVTANGRIGVEAEALDVNKTIYKPVNTSDLLQSVRKLTPVGGRATGAH
jgi:CheY-like chemotaxis protein